VAVVFGGKFDNTLHFSCDISRKNFKGTVPIVNFEDTFRALNILRKVPCIIRVRKLRHLFPVPIILLPDTHMNFRSPCGYIFRMFHIHSHYTTKGSSCDYRPTRA